MLTRWLIPCLFIYTVLYCWYYTSTACSVLHLDANIIVPWLFIIMIGFLYMCFISSVYEKYYSCFFFLIVILVVIWWKAYNKWHTADLLLLKFVVLDYQLSIVWQSITAEKQHQMASQIPKYHWQYFLHFTNFLRPLGFQRSITLKLDTCIKHFMQFASIKEQNVIYEFTLLAVEDWRNQSDFLQMKCMWLCCWYFVCMWAAFLNLQQHYSHTVPFCCNCLLSF